MVLVIVLQAGQQLDSGVSIKTHVHWELLILTLTSTYSSAIILVAIVVKT